MHHFNLQSSFPLPFSTLGLIQLVFLFSLYSILTLFLLCSFFSPFLDLLTSIVRLYLGCIERRICYLIILWILGYVSGGPVISMISVSLAVRITILGIFLMICSYIAGWNLKCLWLVLTYCHVIRGESVFQIVVLLNLVFSTLYSRAFILSSVLFFCFFLNFQLFLQSSP